MTILNTKDLRPRAILATLEKQLNRDNILVIVGSRQVGKTSLLALLFEGLGQKTKIYFDLEDMQLLCDFNNLGLNDFPRYLEEKMGFSLQNKNVFVFIDEIQYLDNPSSLLKYVFDHFKNIKIIVSGSSSLEIKKKFSDRLTGRKYLHTLQPLSFADFLAFKDKKFKIREDVGFKKLLAGTQKIPRPGKKAKRNKYHSGKKKAFTLKTQISINRQGLLVSIDKPVPGRQHDYNVFKKSNLPKIIPILHQIYRNSLQNYETTFGFVANIVNFRMLCRLNTA